MAQASSRLSLPEFHGKIGVARTAITPPVGIYARAWGSAKHDIAEGVHKPLLATCMVFQSLQGDVELVLLTLDMMVFWQGEADRIRDAILSTLRLEPRQLVLHPSHSHSTPFLSRAHADRPGGHLIAPYLDSIPKACCDLVEMARESATPAILTWAYGRCSLAYNRDAVDAASGRDICGLNLTVEADDTVLVGRVVKQGTGEVSAVIVNYACHPVSLGGANKLLSPDYIGAMREVIEAHVPGSSCVFFQGAAGDVTPRRSYEGDVEAADQNGRELGYAALSALTSMFPPGHSLEYQGIEESGTALGIWRLRPKAFIEATISCEVVTASLPVRDMPTRAELERLLKTATERYEIERLERALARRSLVGDGVTGSLPFTVWRLGDSFLVATPAEPYTQFQRNLRARFPSAAVAVLMASDGAKNYLPPPSSYQRDVYQVRVALFEAGSLEVVTDQVTQAIEKARKAAVSA